MSTQRYKPYPTYKDSEVEWLGEIPAHWDVKRADAFLCYEKVQIEPSDISDELVFHYSIPSVQDTGDGVLESPSEIDSAKLRIVGERLLVSKLNPRKGVVLIASEKEVPTVCSTEFVPFQVRRCELRWTLYLFLAESTRQRLSAVVRSATRSHQRAEIAEIVKMWHGVPPVPEQRAIAAFLDREAARIDALVAKKERLIALLQEKRTAVISRAVTKGLDPNVPMKDSGVKWLGQIPAHWEMRRLRSTITSCQNGVWGEEPDGIHDTVCVRVADFDRVGFKVDIADPTLRAIEPGVVAARGLHSGDLLLEKSGGGENQPVGAVVLYDHATPAVCSNFVARVTIANGYDARFLTYLHAALYASRVNTRHIKQSTGIQNLDSASYLSESTGLPPAPEQRAIAVSLDRETARIDALVAKIHDAIERLKELRTALIAAAVTGKIDVRGEVA
jgi:type I restriction enzyme, S subunit